jgi:uncharacterized protein (UPF0333 family)
MELPNFESKNLLLLIAILVVLIIFVMYVKIFSNKKESFVEESAPYDEAPIKSNIIRSDAKSLFSSKQPDVDNLLEKISTLEKKVKDLTTIVNNATQNFARKSDISNAIETCITKADLSKNISKYFSGYAKTSDIADIKTALSNLMKTYDAKLRNYYTKSEMDQLKRK